MPHLGLAHFLELTSKYVQSLQVCVYVGIHTHKPISMLIFDIKILLIAWGLLNTSLQVLTRKQQYSLSLSHAHIDSHKLTRRMHTLWESHGCACVVCTLSGELDTLIYTDSLSHTCRMRSLWEFPTPFPILLMFCEDFQLAVHTLVQHASPNVCICMYVCMFACTCTCMR